MNVGVVSDTHLPAAAWRLPRELERGLRARGVELILHCGDFTAPQVADLFVEIAPFDAVAGNNDGPEIERRFGRKKILTLAGAQVGMVHGDGSRRTTTERALEAFARERVDAILFGHSHQPLCERRGGVWLVNPGSPTQKRRMPHFSYAILEIRDGAIQPTLYYYDDKS